jgi:hypothetical protein
MTNIKRTYRLYRAMGLKLRNKILDFINEREVIRLLVRSQLLLFGLWKVQNIASFHQVRVSKHTLLRQMIDLQPSRCGLYRLRLHIKFM